MKVKKSFEQFHFLSGLFGDIDPSVDSILAEIFVN
jgi:hypothetical protein